MVDKKFECTAAVIETISENVAKNELSSSLQIQSIPAKSFEEALELAKFGKFNYAVIFLVGIIFSAVLVELIGISFALPVAECDLKLGTEEKGMLSGVGFVGIICSSHLWGFLADTQGRRKIMRLTLFLAFVCSTLFSLCTNFWSFLILRFCTGFFIAGSASTTYAYIGELHNNRRRPSAIMHASFIYGLFTILLPGIAWLVINQNWNIPLPMFNFTYKPWRLYIVVCALPSLFCSLAFFFLPESPKFVLGQGDQMQAIATLEQINRWNCGYSAEPLNIQEIYDETASNDKINNPPKSLWKSMYAQTAPLFMRPHLKVTILIGFIEFALCAGSNGTYMWFPNILNRIATNERLYPNERIDMCEIIYRTRSNITILMNETSPLSQECISKLEISTFEHSIVLEIIYALGFAVSGIFINKLSKFTLLFGITIVSAIGSIAAVTVQIPLRAIYSYIAVISCGLGVSIVNACIVEIYPTNLRAMAVSILTMFGRIGSVAMSNLFGVLLDNYCRTAFVFVGIILTVCCILEVFIPNVRKRPEKPHPNK